MKDIIREIDYSKIGTTKKEYEARRQKDEDCERAVCELARDVLDVQIDDAMGSTFEGGDTYLNKLIGEMASQTLPPYIDCVLERCAKFMTEDELGKYLVARTDLRGL